MFFILEKDSKQEKQVKKQKVEHNIIYVKVGNENDKDTPSKIKNVTKLVRSSIGISQDASLTSTILNSTKQTLSNFTEQTLSNQPLKTTAEINDKQTMDISSTLLELGNEVDITSDPEPVVNKLSADKSGPSPSKAITTLDEINRETLKMLRSKPNTDEVENNLEVSAVINAIQATAQPSTVINVESCLKLLKDERISSLLTNADQRIKSIEKSQKKLSPEEKISLKLQNVCEQILSPNVPMSANIASMFAKRRNGSSKTRGIESPELMRVRIAESLLLLGELSKSSCK